MMTRKEMETLYDTEASNNRIKSPILKNAIKEIERFAAMGYAVSATKKTIIDWAYNTQKIK